MREDNPRAGRIYKAMRNRGGVTTVGQLADDTGLTQDAVRSVVNQSPDVERLPGGLYWLRRAAR